MSTTTQILFNSPALHSLKRDQLLKLCKIHSIKANGKNKDLVEKLKEHARTLPSDDPLSVAARSESPREDEDDGRGSMDSRESMARPSDRWEIVMDTIEESEEGSASQPSTLKSTHSGHSSQTAVGEFGTVSSKASSVSSSIKALASSLGLKRSANVKSNLTDSPNNFPRQPSTASSSHDSHNNRPITKHKHSSKDDAYLVANSVPYSSLPEADALPQTDHFTLSELDGDHGDGGDTMFKAKAPADDSVDGDTTLSKPVPGHPLYPGIPAPSNVRLSLGQGTPSESHGQSTTIRLVGAGSSYIQKEEKQSETPQLRPFETAFDLVAGTPGVGGGRVWPVSPIERTGSTYPSLSAEIQGEEDVDMPGAFPVPKFTVTSPTGAEAGHDKALPSQPSPFIFGSPLPRNNVSNTQFSSVAATVFEEMNKRLAEAGVDGAGMDILKRKRMSDAGLGLPLGEGAGGTKKARGGGATAKFEKMHERAFEKMEGIDRHYAARRGGSDKAKGLGAGEEAKKVIGLKRKSDAMALGKGVPKGRVSGARVISNAVRRKMVPATFGDEDAGADGEETEMGGGRQSKKPRFETGKSVSIAPLPNPSATSDGEEMTQQERDREAKRLWKEREAIKRKLEMNRKKRRSSMGRPSLGGRGFVPTQKAKGQTSRFGFLSSAKSLVQSVWNKGAGSTKSKGSTIPASKPTFGFAPKKSAVPSPAPARPSGTTTRSVSSATRIPSGGSTSSRSGSLLKPTAASAAHSPRSPIPSFGTPGPNTNSKAGGSSSGSRARPATKTGSVGGSSRFGTRSISVTGASSMGVRSGVSGVGSNIHVSSLGTRGSVATVNTGAGSMGLKRTASTIGMNMSTRSRGSTSSRLFAPTASSLAKAQGNNMRLSPSNEQMPSMKSPGPSTVPASASSSSSKPALSQITNRVASRPRSPRFRRVFSQPLSPSTPLQNPSLGAAATILTQKLPVTVKAKVLPGRKPRISRSKVIAKLASQRAASGSSASNTTIGKTRSSLGAGKRQSMAGSKMARAVDGIMMSAKKRARQSEYARRRSRAAPGGTGGPLGSEAMDVDDQ